MSTETAPSTAPMFQIDDEVTLTVTGRVVISHAGGIVIEYLSATGWPDRIVARPDAPGVTVTAAEPPSAEERQRRRDAYRRMFVADADADPDERARSLATAPYGGIDPQAVS